MFIPRLSPGVFAAFLFFFQFVGTVPAIARVKSFALSAFEAA
jgi:hypothetical protein